MNKCFQQISKKKLKHYPFLQCVYAAPHFIIWYQSSVQGWQETRRTHRWGSMTNWTGRNDAPEIPFFANKRHADWFEKTRQNHVAVFLQNRSEFCKKWALKARKCKKSLPQRTFRHAKPMLLPFKNYGFTAQNLWFYPLKPMFLQPKTMLFSANICFFRSWKIRFRCNYLLIKALKEVPQNAHISRPIDRQWITSPVWKPIIRIFHDNFRRKNRPVCGVHRSAFVFGDQRSRATIKTKKASKWNGRICKSR